MEIQRQLTEGLSTTVDAEERLRTLRVDIFREIPVHMRNIKAAARFIIPCSMKETLP